MTKVEHDKECTRPKWSLAFYVVFLVIIISIVVCTAIVDGANKQSLTNGYNQGYCYAKGGTVIETYCNVNKTLIPIERKAE